MIALRNFSFRSIGISRNVRLCSGAATNRHTILECALLRVGEYGWTEEALARGAIDAGLPALSHKIIERGPVELVQLFLEKKRNHANTQVGPRNANETGTGRLERLLELHMEYIAASGVRRHWPIALAILAEPTNAGSSLISLGQAADDLCEAVDLFPSRLDWYTERAMLLSYYSSVELFFLTDSSEDLTDTKDFIRRGATSYAELRRDPSLAAGIKACSQTLVSFLNSSRS